MATDRQFIVEALDAQTAQIKSGSQVVATITVVGSRVTGTTAGAAASLSTWAGTGQSPIVGATVTPPAVRVTDANGLPVAGSTVTWQGNTKSGATQTGQTGTSDSNGVVTLGSWSMGTTAGSAYTVLAYSGNLTNSPIQFSITPTAGSAFSVGVSAGDSQSSTPVSQLASRLTALVQDQYGNNVNAAVVTWSSSDADGAFSASTSATNSSGLAGIVYTTGQSASTASVYATLSSGVSARFGIGTYAAAPTTVDILSGDNQTGLSGATLANPLVVFVGDGFNNPWSSGQTLQFVVVAGSGNVSSATSTPDANGLVSVTWKMGATAGTNRLEVSLANISGSTVTFTASGTNPVADTIQIESGNSQTGTAGSALALPLAVATLGSGSSASGQLVTFSATSGSLSTSAIVSSTSGIARTVWTLPTGAGTYTVTASAGTLAGSPLVFSAIANAGTATQLVLATQPSSQPEIGVAWPQQPVVVSADQYGNPASTNTRVQCVLLSGDGTLDSGVSTFATASGATATFSGLSYTYASVNSFQVGFRCNSLSTVTASVQTSQAPFASKLAFTTQPPGGNAAGQGIGTFVVAVEDAGGAVVGSATNAVTVALTSSANTEGGTLSGTLTQNAVAGYATFNSVSLDTAGSFTLDATATGLTGTTSAAFSVVSSSHPNEPTGMTPVFELDFASITELVTAGFTGTSDADLSVVGPATDAMASQFVRSTTSTGRGRYIVGFKSGSGPFNAAKAFTSSNTVYIDFDFAVSSNWSGERSGVGKILFLTGGTSASNPIYCSAQGAAQNNLSFQVRLQGCPPSKGGNNGTGAQNISCGALTRGTKTRIEIVAGMNSVDGSNNGVADGYLKVARDGSTVTERTNMCYRGNDATGVGPTAGFNQIKWNPTYGGNSADTILAEQYQYIGYWYTSRK